MELFLIYLKQRRKILGLFALFAAIDIVIFALYRLPALYPMVQKLLMLFNLRNVSLILTVLAVTVLLFGLLYALIYKLTANAYFSIVSGGRKDG